MEATQTVVVPVQSEVVAAPQELSFEQLALVGGGDGVPVLQAQAEVSPCPKPGW